MANAIFNSSNVYLQGNKIQISFNRSKDLTMSNGVVSNYKYRFVTYPLYAVMSDANYAYYNNGNEKGEGSEETFGAWQDLVAEGEQDKDRRTAILTIPRYGYDVAVRLQITAVDDSDALNYNPVDVEMKNGATIFYAFANEAPQVRIPGVTWQNDTQARLEITLNDLGIVRPANLSEFKSGEKSLSSYWTKFAAASGFSTPEIIIEDNETITGVKDDLSWKNIPSYSFPYTFGITFDVESPDKRSEYTALYILKNSNNYYEWTTDTRSDTFYLAPNVPSLQIKAKAIKVHMPRSDTNTTGAGMFNSNDIGVAHSIALYDTALQGEAPRNNPSIGFYDNAASGPNQLGAVSWNGEGFEFTTDGIIFNVKNYNTSDDSESNAKVKLQFELYDGNPIFKMIPILPSEDEPET